MCLICVEWQKGRMTSKEMLRAIEEQVITLNPDNKEEEKQLTHLQDLMNDIFENEEYY